MDTFERKFLTSQLRNARERFEHCVEINAGQAAKNAHDDVARLEAKLGLTSAAHPRAAVEKDYELTKCTKCGGSGKLAGGKMCPRCLGQGEYVDNVSAPEQPRRFHEPIRENNKNRPVDGPARRQGTTPKGARAIIDDCESRIGRLERDHGIAPPPTSRTERPTTPQKRNTSMSDRTRLVNHDGIVVSEKGSPQLMALAKEIAAEEKISLEAALLEAAKRAPSLVR